MARVPLAEETVQPNGPQAPSPSFPSAIPDAYGANAAEAQAGVGKAVQGIGDILAQHMAERAKMQADEKAYDLGQKVNDYYREKMYGDGTKDVTDPKTGETTTMPQGIMRRTLHNANGSALEIKQARDGADKILEPYQDNPYIYRQAKRYADAHANSAYDTVIAHEASQSELATKYTYINGLKNQSQNMGTAQNDEEAFKMLAGPGGVVESANKVQALTGITQDTEISKAVQNYAMSRITPDGNTDQAQGALAKLSGFINKYDADSISSLIESRGITTQKHAEFKQANAETAQAVSIFQGLADGKPLPTPDEIASANLPTEWKKAFTEASANFYNKNRQGTPATKGGWFGIGAKPAVPGAYDQGINVEALGVPNKKTEDFSNVAANILKSTDQRSMINALLPIIKEKSTTPEEKTALVELFLQRNKNLPPVASTPGLDGAPNQSKGEIPLKQKANDAAISSLMSMEKQFGGSYPEMFRKLNESIVKGQDPNKALDEIVGRENLNRHPEWAKFPESGQPMHDRLGNKVTVFPDGRIVRRK